MTAERTSHHQAKAEDNKEKQIYHISFNWVIRKSKMRHLVCLLGGEWPITWWFSQAWLLLMVYKDSMLQWPVNYIDYAGQDGKLAPGETHTRRRTYNHVRSHVNAPHIQGEKVDMCLHLEVAVPSRFLSRRAAQTHYRSRFRREWLIP